MPTILVLPWRWSGAARPRNALVFASRFDGAGFRQGWRLLIGGIRLRQAVLASPGALGVSLLAHPIQGRYYTLSMWQDQDSLMAFAHGPAHRRAVRGMTELGPVQGVLVSRDADPQIRPTWRDTTSWLTALDTGPYRHQPQPAPAGSDPGLPAR
jgi:hypothetical protein